MRQHLIRFMQVLETSQQMLSTIFIRIQRQLTLFSIR